MRIVRIFIGTLFTFFVSTACGYLIYLLARLTYLPAWLRYVVIGLCAIAILSTLFIWISYIVASLASAREDDDANYFE